MLLCTDVAKLDFLGDQQEIVEINLAHTKISATPSRPVFNASLTTVLGMLPLLADAFYSAMAVTIMVGLSFATVLTMVVIPVNYALIYRIRRG